MDALNILKSAKAYVALGVALGGFFLTVGTDPDTSGLFPSTWVQWLVGAGTALVAFGGVFGVRNARTVEQAQEDLAKAKAQESRPVKKTPRTVTRKPRKVIDK